MNRFVLAVLALITTMGTVDAISAFPLDRGELMMPEVRKVSEEPKTEVLLFSATWCGPCQSLKAKLRKAGLYDDVVLMDCSKSSNFSKYSKKYGFRAVPTVIVLRDGKEIARGGFSTVQKYTKK